MTTGHGVARTGSRLVFGLLGLLIVFALAGCAGATHAESASSILRARPTTPPDAYTLRADGAVAVMREALDKLAALLASPRYMDDMWKSEAVNLATQVERDYRQLDGLTPPTDKEAQHVAIIGAVQECQTLTVYVFQGINNLDKGPFDQVRQRVEACRSKLRAATAPPGSIEEPSPPAVVQAPAREIRAQANRDANLRSGPGTNYAVAATARNGDTFTVVGRTARGDWLRVTSARVADAWIAAFLVQADGDLASVPVAP